MWPYFTLIGIVVAFFIWERYYPVAVQHFEENLLVILLATITIVSFVQVIARYGFHSGWGGALEFTRVCFAWLILLGMSYGIKTGAHLGVDALIHLLPSRAFRIVALAGALITLLYALALLDARWLNLFGADTKGGAIDYWYRTFRIGIGLDDLRYPDWMQQTFGMQERVHRYIAYIALPIGLGLLAFRSLQAFIAIYTGKRALIIAEHEAETLVKDLKVNAQE